MNNRIKELREERNMTQVRLAIELEVSQETVSAYEMGKHFPSMASMLKMSDLFDSRLDYIMGLCDVKKSINEKNLSNDEVTLLSLYKNLAQGIKKKQSHICKGFTTHK